MSGLTDDHLSADLGKRIWPPNKPSTKHTHADKLGPDRSYHSGPAFFINGIENAINKRFLLKMTDFPTKAEKSATEIEAFCTKMSNQEVRNTTVHNPYVIDPDSMPYDKFPNTLAVLKKVWKHDLDI